MTHTWVSDFDADHITGLGDIDADWSFRFTPFNGGDVYGIAWGGGTWVAVGVNDHGVTTPNRTVMTSPDADTWTLRTGPFDGSGSGFSVTPGGQGRCVAYGAGQFVAGGTAAPSGVTLATSPDGITWTQRPSPFDGGIVSGVAYGAGLWVAVGRSPDGLVTLCTSPNGITWTHAATPWDGTTDAGGQAAVRTRAAWVAVGDAIDMGPSTIRSVDGGVTWTAVTSPLDGGEVGNIARSPRLLLATGHNATSGDVLAASTDDGATWTARTAPADFATRIFKVDWSSYWVAVGAGAWSSPDGVTWTNIITPSLAFRTVAHRVVAAAVATVRKRQRDDGLQRGSVVARTARNGATSRQESIRVGVRNTYS